MCSLDMNKKPIGFMDIFIMDTDKTDTFILLLNMFLLSNMITVSSLT